MRNSRKWQIIITLTVIFGTGLVVGLWLNRTPQPPVTVSPPVPYQPVTADESVVMRVYQELSPAVVNIVTQSQALNFWMQLVPQFGQGSGFVIDGDGHIVTNNHVVANAQNIEVTFMGERKVPAVLVGRDPISDLAIIKVDPFEGMVVAPLGNSDALQVGQRDIAIGNPLRLPHTVTAGFVSALNRELLVGERTMMGLIQTDAAINPGNSGGPLINSKGEVIGINTAIYSQTGSSVGIGLAQPINRVKKVAGQIVKWGRAIYPWVGIQSWMDISSEMAQRMGFQPVRGILVFQVAPGSPADRAGLRGGTHRALYGGRPVVYQGRPVLLGGDVILSLDDAPTPTFDDLQNIVVQKNIGAVVRLKALRGNQELTLNVTLAPDPTVPR